MLSNKSYYCNLNLMNAVRGSLISYLTFLFLNPFKNSSVYNLKIRFQLICVKKLNIKCKHQ
jgi:hypothetical protein